MGKILSLFSSKPKHIDDINQKLATIIPVIYGAVFSYSVYIFSQIILGLDNPKNINGGLLERDNYWGLLIFYILVTHYLIGDIATITRLEKAHPYRTSVRYTWEIMIAIAYLTTYATLLTGKYISVISFCFVILLCGIWFKKFKCELLYEKKNNEADYRPPTQENILLFAFYSERLHYFGFVIFTISTIVFMQIFHNEIIDPFAGIIYLIIYFLWDKIGNKIMYTKLKDIVLKYNG